MPRGRRKSISFSKNTLSQLFFNIGEILREDSEESNIIYNRIIQGVNPGHEKKYEFPNFFDKDITKNDMKKILDEYDIKMLQEAIRGLSLDPNRLTVKWKEKDKLIEFILDTRKKLLLKFI